MRKKRLIRIKEVLWALSMFGFVAITARLINGLGATTALSDANPWGLWKIGNMVAGVALGTCGFAVAAIVYSFHLERYHKLVRPAVLIAFLGYGSSCFSLFLDIGIPWRIWHAIIYWNVHSFLFEVAMCVMFYFSVTCFEMLPVVTEGKWHKFAHTLHRISLPIVFFGITLSTMHHTTLGSLFLVTPTRLHEIWFSPWVWGLFITSAVGSGLMTLVFICIGVAGLYGRKPDLSVLGSMAKAGMAFLAFYGIFKAVDLSHRGVWPTVFSGEWEGVVFIVESFLLVILPVLLVLYGPSRRSATGLMIATGSAMIGVVMNRIDVGIVGYFRTAGFTYFPSFPEILISVGVYAAAALVFLFVIETFEVFDKPPFQPLEDNGRVAPPLDALDESLAGSFRRYSAVALVSLVASIGVFAVFSNSVLSGAPMTSETVESPSSPDPTRAELLINGNRNDVEVLFKHDWHKSFLGKDKSCATCHHIDMPNDKNTACWKCHRNMELKTPIFSHSFHVDKFKGNEGCGECHVEGQPEKKENTKACADCHEKDMRMAKSSPGEYYDYNAPSYVDAIHRSCVECHIKKQNEVNRPVLEECYTCHGDVKLQTVRWNRMSYH